MAKQLDAQGTFGISARGQFANIRLSTDGEHSPFVLGPKHVSVGQRVFENVQDGQAPHCAATKGYVDSKFENVQLSARAEQSTTTATTTTTTVPAHCCRPAPSHHHHGFQGHCGKRGTIGPQGVPGEKGPRGTCGKEGCSGIRGHRGYQGFQASNGPQGVIGNIGVQGRRGPRGDAGEKGHVGSMGHRGHKGETGDVGPQGLTGPMGLSGHAGKRGHCGESGETGPMGPQGDIGNFGVQGHMGREGHQGPVGKRGCNGDEGIRGARGYQGIYGPQGPLSTIKKQAWLSFSTPDLLTDSHYIGCGSSGGDFITQSCVAPFSGALTDITACIRDNATRGVLSFQLCTSAPNGTNLQHTDLIAQLENSQVFDTSQGHVLVNVGDLLSVRYYCVETNTLPLANGATTMISLIEE